MRLLLFLLLLCLYYRVVAPFNINFCFFYKATTNSRIKTKINNMEKQRLIDKTLF
jgi:hypothetical protein